MKEEKKQQIKTVKVKIIHLNYGFELLRNTFIRNFRLKTVEINQELLIK